MKLAKYSPYMVVLALLGAATLLLKYGVSVAGVEAPGVMLRLPERVGTWSGEDLYYCQNESCLYAGPRSELTDALVCPRCGGAMRMTWSVAERQLLPADTILLKKFYRPPAGPGLQVAVVVSGAEQVSIHRPQICLAGQGYEIESERTVLCPLDRDRSLGVRVLEVLSRDRSTDGRLVERGGVYAYWFVSRHYVTPSHARRMLLSAWDRLAHGRVIRWAYVSVSGSRLAGAADDERQATAFIREFYPLIMAGTEP